MQKPIFFLDDGGVLNDHAVRTQLEELQYQLLKLLSKNLVGLYLHGSLAMGGFNPARSDLDLLVVTEHPLSPETQYQLLRLLLQLSKKPYPIEISFLSLQDLHPWRYPTPYQLHFSEDWRSRYEEQLALEAGQREDTSREQPTDPDLAAHITILHQRGLRLYGRPIAEVFPPVPRADYVDSIVQDFHWAKKRLERDPVYFVLNACRVWGFLQDGEILSKAEAGEWARRALPERFRLLVEAAREAYLSPDPRVLKPELPGIEDFAAWMERQVDAFATR